MISIISNHRPVQVPLALAIMMLILVSALPEAKVQAEFTQCNDSIDNDRDGNIDYPADPGCFTPDDNDETNLTSAFMFDPNLSLTPSFIVTMTDGRSSAEPGDILTYQIIIKNSSVLAVAGVKVIDILPRELVFNSASDGGTGVGQLVQWEGLMFLPGETKVLRLYATVPSFVRDATRIVNVAQIERGPSAQDFTMIQGRTGLNGLQLSVTRAPGSAQPGRFITYFLTVRNNDATNRTIQLRATLDIRTLYSLASDQGRSRGLSEVSWGNIFVKGRDERTVRLTVLVKPDASAGETISLLARADRLLTGNSVTLEAPSFAVAPYGQKVARW